MGPAIWILSLLMFEAVRDDLDSDNDTGGNLDGLHLACRIRGARSLEAGAVPSALLAVIFYACHAVVFPAAFR